MIADFAPLIIGADGLIGNALIRYFRSICPRVMGTSRKGTDGMPFFDISNPNFNEIDLSSFSHVIVAGANPNISSCETNPELTSACNLTGALKIAEEAASYGIQPVLFSTDYVYDGVKGAYKDEDPTSPVNEYGKQKAELERRLPKITSENFLILRLAKVYLRQATGKNFLGEIAEKLRHNEQVYAALDQIFTPVLLDDVVLGVAHLMKRGAKGLFNLGGPEKWSRFEIASNIARAMRANSDLIKPISLNDLQESFKRPKRTDLISCKFEDLVCDFKRTCLSQVIKDLFC